MTSPTSRLRGALLGSIIVVGMQKVLNLMHVSAYWQYVWIGIITVIGVATYSTNWSGIIRLRRRPARLAAGAL